MTWLRTPATGPSALERVLGLRPELLALYRAFYGRLWDDLPVAPKLLELCRLRIAALHGCDAEGAIRHRDAGVSADQITALADWRAKAIFTPLERAALAIAEKIPWQPREITDGEVASLRAWLSDAEVVAFMLAITLFDLQCRLRLTFAVAAEPVTVAAPASGGGTLY
jgi:alkylhydroperoxidase family enzyme